tara:strand:- start:280 stop:489 length:210 start_codon:yes stop_codon:yes gene_type:complete
MTGIEHSLLATATIAAFYYFGRWQGKKENIENIIESTLNMLEKNNMIKVKVDKNGEKEILPLDKYEKVW